MSKYTVVIYKQVEDFQYVVERKIEVGRYPAALQQIQEIIKASNRQHNVECAIFDGNLDLIHQTGIYGSLNELIRRS